MQYSSTSQELYTALEELENNSSCEILTCRQAQESIFGYECLIRIDAENLNCLELTIEVAFENCTYLEVGQLFIIISHSKNPSL